jgi:acyl-CoA thioester hydrolase
MSADAVHRWTLRVYYEDTDAGGLVYHANYLKFAERARTEFLRAHGFEHRALRQASGLVFAVRRCTAEFLAPARLDDAITVETRILNLGGASIELDQRICCEGTELARLTLRLACLNAVGRPARIPAELRHAFAQIGGQISERELPGMTNNAS